MDRRKDTKLVKFHAVKSEAEAELIKHMLDREDIPCSILNINSSKLLPELPPNICGVEIWIPSIHIDKAKHIIQRLKSRRGDRKRGSIFPE